MEDNSRLALLKILGDCLLLLSVCAAVWICFSLGCSGIGQGIANLFSGQAGGAYGLFRTITFDRVFACDVILYGLSCALLFRQGVFIRSLLKTVGAMVSLAVLCLAMWLVFPRSSTVNIWNVLLGMWVVAFSGVVLVSVLNLFFLFRGMRLVGIALLLLFGGWLYAVVDVRFDREPPCVNNDPIRPLHVVNQLVGITLPSRGTLTGGTSSSEQVDVGLAEPSAVKDGGRGCLDAKKLSRDVKPKEVMAFQFVHLLFYLYFISLALSFSNKEMLHRIIIKLFFFRKVHVFWDGGNTREASQYAAESLGRQWLDDAVIVVDGRKQGQQSNLCDRLTCKWISADTKTGDDVVSIARCHYFLGSDGDDNILRAAELKASLDMIRWRMGVVDIFVKVDSAQADAKSNPLLTWIAAQPQNGEKKSKVVVHAFRECDLVACDCFEKIEKAVDVKEELTIGFLGDEHYFKALSRLKQKRDLPKMKLIDLGNAGMHSPDYFVVAYDDLDKAIKTRDRIPGKYLDSRVFMLVGNSTVSTILGLKEGFVFGQQRVIYAVDKIRDAADSFVAP